MDRGRGKEMSPLVGHKKCKALGQAAIKGKETGQPAGIKNVKRVIHLKQSTLSVGARRLTMLDARKTP